MKYAYVILLALLAAGCATKDFGDLHELSPDIVEDMNCKQIENEFFRLRQYESSVDEEATTGQVQQIFWGGLWSVMADEKLEAIARKDIRDRVTMLYEAKVDKGCR